MHKLGRTIASQIEPHVAAQSSDTGESVLEVPKFAKYGIGKRAAVFSGGIRRGTGHVSVLSLCVWRTEGGPLEHDYLLGVADR